MLMDMYLQMRRFSCVVWIRVHKCPFYQKTLNTVTTFILCVAFIYVAIGLSLPFVCGLGLSSPADPVKQWLPAPKCSLWAVVNIFICFNKWDTNTPTHTLLERVWPMTEETNHLNKDYYTQRRRDSLIAAGYSIVYDSVSLQNAVWCAH